ncbi:sterol 3-beta-glucosyltransferase UGT80A2-like isoform X3 [Pistacia vera]|uniref:sterol 3-beta-glucosyltransferase UGT80A2-like isoform X3 n=1 Tax=Pistacia vera TaxID=55513 RepID=UPI0012637481|nr:sterol 3-beta-glucosyltransferase UGT80A2-like isoform X3 [Pistacia vera]
MENHGGNDVPVEFEIEIEGENENGGHNTSVGALTSTVGKPVATSTVEKPVSTSTVEKLVSTSDAEKPVLTSTVEKPVSTSTAEKPVSTSNAEKPVLTSTVEKPVSTSTAGKPVSALTSTAEKLFSTSTAEEPVSTSIAKVPVSTSTAEEPVSTSIAKVPVSTSTAEELVSTSTPEKPVLTSTQAVKPVKNGNNRKLSMLAAKLVDDTVPLKKKLKCLKEFATVKTDGTVQFEVPGDIKPQSLDFGTGVVYNGSSDKETAEATAVQDVPPLQIVMLIVGTRGDVQPFVAIGKRLQEDGHRVRLATHSNFKDFVLSAGLEFFPLGGDPKVLAGYMVKNKGFLPSGPSEIPIQRNQMKEIIFSLLPACKEPDPESTVPFKPDAIIANPPAYGHTHVAEALKVPLHIIFTMPWTPTSDFPHPLSRVRQHVAYRLSYQIVDALIWLGIRDMINEFRKKKLKLRPVTYLSGSWGSPQDVPYGYIWSPHLVPKPKDWGPKIDVVGFCFLDLASTYQPPDPLVKWLEEGKKPIYIGFGSLPVQEPEKMTETIVKALEITGQRGIINKGWGGLGNLAEPKNFVYLLDNCPHDWLFLRCSAVVKQCAVELAKAMENEDGVTGAVKAFYKHFPGKVSDEAPESPHSRSGFCSMRQCFGYT